MISVDVVLRALNVDPRLRVRVICSFVKLLLLLSTHSLCVYVCVVVSVVKVWGFLQQDVEACFGLAAHRCVRVCRVLVCCPVHWVIHPAMNFLFYFAIMITYHTQNRDGPSLRAALSVIDRQAGCSYWRWKTNTIKIIRERAHTYGSHTHSHTHTMSFFLVFACLLSLAYSAEPFGFKFEVGVAWRSRLSLCRLSWRLVCRCVITDAIHNSCYAPTALRLNLFVPPRRDALCSL